MRNVIRASVSMCSFLLLGACQPQATSEIDTLDDIKRGSYALNESCSANKSLSMKKTLKPSILSTNLTSITAYGQKCDARASGKVKAACESVVRSLKTLPNEYLNFMSDIGMAITVHTKAQTLNLTKLAFKAKESEIGNIRSYWVAAKGSSDDFLTAVVRIEDENDPDSDISFGLLRTLGDFMARGILGLKKDTNGVWNYDGARLANISNSDIHTNQANLTGLFFKKHSDAMKSNLLKSVLQGKVLTQADFVPQTYKQNVDSIAMNVGMFVTTEAMHQYYCNETLKKKFDDEKFYKNMKKEMESLEDNIILKIASLSRSAGLVAESENSQKNFEELLQEFRDELILGEGVLSSANSVDERSTSNSAPAYAGAVEISDSSSNEIAQELKNCGCQNCNGSCSQGGTCSCSCSGCAASSGSSCSCSGSCNCTPSVLPA